ncbi:MAG TPA: GNAT family N-acetyltransferase [Rhizomicrobium sp.]|jgi:GNAT superfamily N-acetyltransferase|nr:GNAT family N-acetyltransferase [Rhizomicrobium sp.]
MLAIAPLCRDDIAEVGAAFAVLNKTVAQYERYFAEQQAGARLVLVARLGAAVCGYLTINWQPDYAPFRAAAIPEIQDFNVLPACRHRHVGTALMDEAERLVRARSSIVGIGVGLHHDYGAAQRLYVLRGYVPDARGITAHGRRVNWNDDVKSDDDLVLWLTKTIS